MEQPDPSQMRVSDEDRHKVADVLRDAAAEGRIDFEELEERLEATYAAKTYGDLVPLTIDLPNAGAAPVHVTPQPAPVASSGTGAVSSTQSWPSSVVMMGEVARRGVWDTGTTHAAFALMGSVILDLREARFVDRELVITANVVMGEVKVIVNAGTHVVVDGVGIMGEFCQNRDKTPAELGADSPVVRIRGMALMGSVNVTRKRMPGEPGAIQKFLGT